MKVKMNKNFELPCDNCEKDTCNNCEELDIILDNFVKENSINTHVENSDFSISFTDNNESIITVTIPQNHMLQLGTLLHNLLRKNGIKSKLKKEFKNDKLRKIEEEII